MHDVRLTAGFVIGYRHVATVSFAGQEVSAEMPAYEDVGFRMPESAGIYSVGFAAEAVQPLGMSKVTRRTFVAAADTAAVASSVPDSAAASPAIEAAEEAETAPYSADIPAVAAATRSDTQSEAAEFAASLESYCSTTTLCSDACSSPAGE